MSDADNLENGTPKDAVAAEIPEKFRDAEGNLDQEAFLKSYSDMEKHSSRVLNENNTLKENAQVSEALVSQGKTLEMIAENTAQKGDPEPTMEDYLKAKATELGLEEDDPYVKISAEVAFQADSWHKQDIANLKKENDAEIATLREELAGDKAAAVKQTPEYLANATAISELVEAGMPEASAITHVLDKVAKQSDVSDPPAATPAGAVRDIPSNDEPYWDSPEQRAKFAAERGEPVAKRMEEAYAKRMILTAKDAERDKA